MYPFLRLALVIRAARKRAPLPLDGVSELRLTCMPWDLDLFFELNNGRVLSLYDLGRFDHGVRVGLVDALRPKDWAFAVGGASVRYRRRVRMFDRLTLRTQALGRDARWFYVHQAMEARGDTVSAGLMRVCVTDRQGIVPTDEVLAALGAADFDLSPPEWAQAWIAAEDQRPWPPVFGSAVPGARAA